MTLTNAVNLYIGARQAAGERFHSPAVVLRSFSHQAGNKSLNIITPEEIVGFLSGPRTGHGTWQKKYGTLRVFFEYWRQRQKLSVVPMPPSLPKYTSPFMPYIYSKEELRSLLKVIPQCQQRRWCQMSDATFRMLLLLLYGTGMRIGEALRLCLIDVDLDNDIIQIR
jgi:integrase/recombinase XerD